MVTALCNVFINSESKFALFKQSFPLVAPISDNWLIYIRGKYKEETENFIKSVLKNIKYHLFQNLYNTDWAKSTSEMVKYAKYEYIYIYLEDHFLITNISDVIAIINEMISHQIDYLPYSFFGVEISKNNIEKLGPNYYPNLMSFDLKKKDLSQFRREYRKFYPFSLASISKISYFKKILNIEKNSSIKVPFIIQAILEKVYFTYPNNRILWFHLNKFISPLKIRLVIYTKSSPFNLERSLYDSEPQLLPLKIAIPNKEIFTNWDDDNGRENSSLIKRGLYPSILKADIKKLNVINGKKYQLAKGKTIEGQYFPDIPRISKIPLKEIKVCKGTIKVSSNKESYTIKDGSSIVIHSNIPHQIEALANSLIMIKII